ncbi:hypothetical protein GCM10007857_27530 [Bradyrhizobium iriomotense]|uniref:Uncharacterized protein n=1 Tax=Bradyrhizobium iriomotense TaxID=441950 RepID=A0ABQ6B1Q7_9BRAD|nr:hypothetical protein GCM10007857_27530 [Bradyrhizobium iriomotense]
MKTVQVTRDAKASPIITAFTMMSADMNITQGDSSFITGITGAVDFCARLASADAASDAGAAGAAVAAGATGDGAAVAAAGVAGWDAAGGVAVCCCAETGTARAITAIITVAAKLARKGVVFILRPSSE